MTAPSVFRMFVVAATVVVVAGTASAGPVFIHFMADDKPVDRMIMIYWERAEQGVLDAPGMIDLGTMLFRRGFVNDAAEVFKRAAKMDKEAAEPWFRLGLIEHQRDELRAARRAYMKCLDRASGHGWCNYYVGQIDEARGASRSALEHYEAAFRHAPELADPAVNPQILYSNLYVGALVAHTEEERFAQLMPVGFVQPAKVKATRERVLAELGLDQPAEPPPEVQPEAPKPPPQPPQAPAATADPKKSPLVGPSVGPKPVDQVEPPKVEESGGGATGRTEAKPEKKQPPPAEVTQPEQPRKRRRPTSWRNRRIQRDEPPAEPEPSPTPVPPPPG